MAGKAGDSAIAIAPNNPQALNDQVDLSQRIQSLAINQSKPGAGDANPAAGAVKDATAPAQPSTDKASQAAPTGKWDKFVDVTEQGVKDIPQGMLHALENPAGLIENAAISVAFGTAAKVLMPETGPLGKLFAVGLGAYFAEQTAVPVYKAYKSGMQAKTMGDINAAGGQLGDAVGGLTVNLPIGIYGYKLGAGIGDSMMASPKMSGFVQLKADTLNPINDALSSGIDASKARIASLWNGKLGGARLNPTEATTQAPAPVAEQADAILKGRVETTDKAPETTESDKAATAAPTLPERYASVQKTFAGTKVPGISDQYLQNLESDPSGTYYGAGLRYPDVMADPEMAAYLTGHNALTMASIDKDVYAQEVANETKAASYKLPADWDTTNSGPALTAIDVTDGGEGTMRVGLKTYTLTDDGAPNRKLVVSDPTHGSKTVIPESKDFEMQQVIHVKANGADKFAVVGSQDGASVLHVFNADGTASQAQIQLPGFGTLHDVRQGANPSELKFLYDTPISAPRVLTLDVAGAKSSLSAPSDVFDTSKLVTDKVVASYADREGKMQEVPFYVSHSTDMPLNGKNLAMFKIYGGFDVGPQYDGYSPNTASWLERGGVAVDPVLPGDGGLGSGNYQEGLGAGIENANLAMIAIIEKLHDMGISSPETTGVYGRSNGGMMVNALLNHRPDLVGAAVSESGVNSLFDSPKINVDTGRYWLDEFGDPTKASQVGWMSKLDVLNNLSAAKQYPPTLVEIGTKDGVVNVGNGITYANMRQQMGNGETLLFSRFGEGHDPAGLNLGLQTAFLWDRLKPKTAGT